MREPEFRVPGGGGEGDAGGTSVNALIRILRRWRRPFYAFAVGLPVVTAVVLLLTPNKFTSTGTILVETPEAGLLGSDLLSQFSSFTGIPTQASPSEMYLAILRSERVGTAVADSLGLAEYYEVKGKTPEERREKTLVRLAKRTVMDTPDQVTIHVAATDQDPQRAADIVNAYLHQLDQASQTLALSRARRTRRMVERTLEDGKVELDSTRTRFQRFQEEYGVFEIEKQTEGALDLIGGLQSQLVQAQTERKALASYASEGSSQMRVLDLKIQALREEIQKLLGGLKLVARPRADVGGGNQGAGQEPLFVPLNQLPELAGQYARLLMDLKVQESKYNILATQLEQTKIEESQSIPAFEILDWGKRPYRKSGPFRTLYTLAALAAGVLAGIFFAVLLEDLDRRVSPETRHEVLGLVPSFLREPAMRLFQKGAGRGSGPTLRG